MSYTTYTSHGPFTNGAAPGLDASLFNDIETMLAAGWFDSAITSDGSGLLTTLGLVLNGLLTLLYPASSQTLTNNAAITVSGPVAAVTASASVTGITLPDGSAAGQFLLVVNTAGTGFTVSFSGTNIRDVGNVSVQAGHLGVFLWSGGAWYKHV